MKRFKILFGQRRFQVLATLAVLLLAVSVVVASGANFTSTSANPGNVFTAGTLTTTNDGAVLTVSDLKPDSQWVDAGSVTLSNTGSLAGDFTLSTSNLKDTPGANKGDLSGVLDLQVVDHKTGKVVYTGAIDNVGTVDLGTWASGESHQYDFSVQFPDGGTPKSDTTGDNAYQGSSMSIDFDWTAVSQ